MILVIRKNVLIIAAVFAAAVFTACIFDFHKDVRVFNADSKVFVVDAGHGGVDGGAVGIDNTVEKDLNLAIARKLEKILTDNGFTVVMTRDGDVSIHDDSCNTIREMKKSDLLNRAGLVNLSNARLLVSIHMNKFDSPKASGAQVFFSKNDNVGEQYAEKVSLKLKEIYESNYRAAKPLPNKNLLFSKIEIPGILVECGFLSNKSDTALLKSDEYQARIAQAIFEGIR
jgi:N-acetylmuramoyl-L-alanine amidase